jgi:serine/threonine-protein kinase
MKAMAKSPDDRYATAEEFRADLLRFTDGRPVEAGDPGATTTMAPIGAPPTMLVTGQTQALALGGAGGGAMDGRGGAGGRGGGGSRAEQERQRRVRRMVILLVALLVVLGVIAFFLVRALTTTSQVVVPSVAGQTLAQATQTLNNDNLTVGATTVKTSSSVTKGAVISSNPAGGVKVNKNSAVALVVSAGTTVRDVSVPSVVGQQLVAATNVLTGEGLTYKVSYVSSTKSPGTVLTQDPAGGASVPSTTVVKLTVSLSQSAVSVPNVVGLSQTSAGSTITSNNLTVGTQSSACSQQVSAGNVASQTPAAGTQQPPNTAVNLVISTGPCSTTVPNVVGLSQTAAGSAITGTPGLTPTFTQVDCSSNGGTAGQVQSQSPSAGTVLSPPFPQTVTIAVCSTSTTTTTAPSTTTTTTVGGSTTTTTS